MDGSRNILWGGDNNILGARIIGENLDYMSMERHTIQMTHRRWDGVEGGGVPAEPSDPGPPDGVNIVHRRPIASVVLILQ